MPAQIKLPVLAIVSLLGMVAAAAAMAENIAVGNYGSSANGMPFAVALEKGYFQQEGQCHRHHRLGGRRYVGAQRHGRRRLSGEASPGAIAVAINRAPTSRSSAITCSRSPNSRGW